MSIRNLTLTLAVLAAGLLVACGDSSTSSSDTSSPPAPAAKPAPRAPVLEGPASSAAAYQVIEVADGDEFALVIARVGARVGLPEYAATDEGDVEFVH